MNVQLTDSIEDVRKRLAYLAVEDYYCTAADEIRNPLAESLRMSYVIHVGLLLERIDKINAATQD